MAPSSSILPIGGLIGFGTFTSLAAKIGEHGSGTPAAAHTTLGHRADDPAPPLAPACLQCMSWKARAAMAA